MKKEKMWHLRWEELQPWLAGVLVVLSSAWFADSMRDGFEAIRECMNIPGWVSGLLYLVILIIAIAWLYHTRKALFQPRTRYLEEHKKPEPHPYLVLFLSDLYLGKNDIQEGIPNWLTLTNNIDDDLNTMEQLKDERRDQQWRWEMPLRGLRHHAKVLKQVVIVCSDKSIEQVHWFYKILRRYPNFQGFDVMILLNDSSGTVQLTPCTDQERKTGGWDFEQFNNLATAMRELFKIFQNKKIPEEQIMIDFTGGQKVTSVVAVAITFNRDSSAQYVSTNAPWDVVSYDVEYGSSDTGGVGI